MVEEETLSPEINLQLCMLNSINRAIRIRQEDPKLFHHAVAGVWCSLFPQMKEKLIEKLDGIIADLSGGEIRDFDKNGFDTSYDLFSCIESHFNNTSKHDARIMTGEILLTKIQEILHESGILGAKKSMPEIEMRKRRISATLEGDQE